MQGVARKALEKAIEVVGSKVAVQQRLKVQAHTLDLWLAGKADIPHDAFSTLTDLLIEEDLRRQSKRQ